MKELLNANPPKEHSDEHLNDRSKEQFRGRFEVKLDPKGRLSLPSAYRQTPASSLSSQPPQPAMKPPQLIVTNSRFRKKSCLHIYTWSEWKALERKISRLSSLKTEVQAFSRFYLSGGQPVEVDSQNRILIPQSLRKFAGLDGQAVLVGLGSKFEVWSQAAWNEIYEDLTETFEDTLSAVADLDDSTGEVL